MALSKSCHNTIICNKLDKIIHSERSLSFLGLFPFASSIWWRNHNIKFLPSLSILKQQINVKPTALLGGWKTVLNQQRLIIFLEAPVVLEIHGRVQYTTLAYDLQKMQAQHVH